MINSSIGFSEATNEKVESFMHDLRVGHIQPDLKIMSKLYHERVCAIEAASVYFGREKVMEALTHLLKQMSFESWDWEVVSGDESEDTVWLYVVYRRLKMRLKDSGQQWEIPESRCTYVLKKTLQGLVIMQNHASIPAKLSGES